MESLRDNYELNGSSWLSLSQGTDGSIAGQTFTPSSSYDVTKVGLLMKRTGWVGHDCTLSLYDTNATNSPGVALETESFDGQAITSSDPGEWVELEFTTPEGVTKNTQYAIICTTPSVSSNSRLSYWGSVNSGYSGGAFVTYNSGWYYTASQDAYFRAYGVTPTPDDKLYSKRLLAIAGNQVWYESVISTLSEISAARDDIDTANPLTVAYAFQKAFIANQTNLKIVDLATTKLSTSQIGAAGVSVPLRTAILSGQTSGAGMVVDFLTDATGSAYIYGYKIGATSFISGETILGEATTSVSFAILSTEASAPHWIDWTVFANDNDTYGYMPYSAYICCRYRGRLVVAGHPTLPHQWWMSKIGDPFNFIYDANNPITAIKGNDADAGEVGDIIRALIPYGDDFLLMGCANSIHVMNGDPASGGSIDELSDDTGIFSPWSWCKDGNGNLYFYGNHGVYRILGGREMPELISSKVLPNIDRDWQVSPTSHRITLHYDNRRNAILIIKATFDDGSNEAYWYNLDSQGFYPCDFPDACGIFSGVNYNADAPSNREALYGCNDGYIRYMDDDVTNDDSGNTDTPISSYVTFPIMKLTENEDLNGKLNSLTFINAGGAISGSFGDSNGFDYEIHVGDDAETVLENIKDGASALVSGSISTPGRQARIRTKVKANYLGLKIFSVASDVTWAIDRVSGDVKEAGKVR